LASQGGKPGGGHLEKQGRAKLASGAPSTGKSAGGIHTSSSRSTFKTSTVHCAPPARGAPPGDVFTDR
jgi:hypothetical protein